MAAPPGAVASLFTTILILPKHIWEPVISMEMPINSTTPNEELTYLYQHPVGCGPYVLDRESTNSAQITLKKNPNYFLKAEDGSDLYKVDTIKFILYQEQNVAMHFGVFLFIFSKKRFQKAGFWVKKFYSLEYKLLALYLPILALKVLSSLNVLHFDATLKAILILAITVFSLVVSAFNAVKFQKYLKEKAT